MNLILLASCVWITCWIFGLTVFPSLVYFIAIKYWFAQFDIYVIVLFTKVFGQFLLTVNFWWISSDPI